MRTIRFKVPAIIITAISFLEFLNFLIGPFGMPRGKTILDFIFLIVLLFHGLWVYRLVKGNRRQVRAALYRTPEILFAATLILFLLSYIFASNAGPDQLQHFGTINGNIALSSGSVGARVNSLSRFLPLLAVQVWLIILFRVRAPLFAARSIGSTHFSARWGMGFAILSAFLFTIAFPSFVSLNGFGKLAFVALVPLFLTFHRSGYWRSVFYGITFGAVETLLTNYWLGNFRLLSLELLTLLTIVEFAIFMLPTLFAFRRLPRAGYLILPLAWVAFDWLKSLGFLGYPWDMVGATQYRFDSFIQIASITGIWGVSFMVLAANAVIAHAIHGYVRKRERRFALSDSGDDGAKESMPRRGPWSRFVAPFGFYIVAFVAVFVYGNIAKVVQSDKRVRSVATVALIQQNTDPHKEGPARSLAALKKLTDKSLFYRPDLVVWPQASFVPDLRASAKHNGKDHTLTQAVKQFLTYENELGHWLVTGSDDHTASLGPHHKLIQREFDSAVLFSANGHRKQTYHAVRLLPYTEYYSPSKHLPFVYRLLPNFDGKLLQPGKRFVVFKTPKLDFSTPIGFEDAFPNDVRQFVAAGAQAIITLSNDSRSRSSVEGQQHFMNSLFRAVENRRPLLRASSAGLTGYVDTLGRLVAAAPYNKPAFLVVTVPLKKEHETLYTRIGDWFPKLTILIYLVFFVAALRRRDRTSKHDREPVAVAAG